MTHVTSNATASSEIRQESRHFRTTWIIAAALLGFLGVGSAWWQYSLSHVTTNDARVEGHIHPLNARVSGTVEWIAPNLEDTHYVEAGTVLARLDANDYQPSVDRLQGEVDAKTASVESAKLNLPITQAQSASRLLAARASISQAEAVLAASISGVATAEAHARSAQASYRRAEDDRVRYEGLMKAHEISRSEYDQHETEAETMRHQLEAAKSGIVAAQRQVDVAQHEVAEKKAELQAAETAPELNATAKSNVASAMGQLRQAQAELQRARLDVGYTQIVAPVSGVVSRKSIEVGQRVQAGDMLLTVIPLTDLWVTAEYKETQLHRMRAGQPVTIRVDASGATYSGIVDSIGGATGSVSSLLPPENATGNFVKVIQRIPVRIKLNDLSNRRESLVPGMSVEPTVFVR